MIPQRLFRLQNAISGKISSLVIIKIKFNFKLIIIYFDIVYFISSLLY